jgi:hypothetical protein
VLVELVVEEKVELVVEFVGVVPVVPVVEVVVEFEAVVLVVGVAVVVVSSPIVNVYSF